MTFNFVLVSHPSVDWLLGLQQVTVADLKLSPQSQAKLIELAGVRYNAKTGELRLVSKRSDDPLFTQHLPFIEHLLQVPDSPAQQGISAPHS